MPVTTYRNYTIEIVGDESKEVTIRYGDSVVKHQVDVDADTDTIMKRARAFINLRQKCRLPHWTRKLPGRNPGLNKGSLL